MRPSQSPLSLRAKVKGDHNYRISQIVGYRDRITTSVNLSTKPQNTKYFITFDLVFIGHTKNTPRGIRIPVTSVKGRCPRPLDDGGMTCNTLTKITNFRLDVNRFSEKIFSSASFAESKRFLEERNS
jgi:hypothetical protein